MKKYLFFAFVVSFFLVGFTWGQSGNPILFSGDKGSLYWITIRDSSNRLIKFLPAFEKEEGKYLAMWDGTDFTGKDVPSGKYNAYMSKNIEWTLDRNFGISGRIGLFQKEVSVDTDMPQILIQGKVSSVFVNDIEYRDTGDNIAGETSFIVQNSKIIISPAKIKKGDIVKISYFFPCFFENPWDMAIAPDGGIFVLLRLQKMVHGMYPGMFIKLKPDGRSVDTNFGVDGEIPGIYRSHQVVVVPQENRIYIAGSEYGTYGTGSYKLDTGAYWFYIGGHKDQGRHPATTWWPTGICIGEGNKIYIGDLKVYDRTKPMLEGYLYSAKTDPYIIRPGPSMENSAIPGIFYRTGWNTGISKMKDIGNDVVEIYSLKLPFKTIGITCDAKRSLIFAGSRMPEGFVSVIYDDGKSFKEITSLKDSELGGIHTVRIMNDTLYVIEDSVSYAESGYCAEEMNVKPWTSKGKNRISKYRISFGKEIFLQKLEKR